jgi:hypothetical protein
MVGPGKVHATAKRAGKSTQNTHRNTEFEPKKRKKNDAK